MLKLLRHLWVTVGFATAFLGILLIPNDIADSQQAIAWWSAQLTPTNREIILVALLAIFGARVAYMDIQGALNSHEWKPLRHRFTAMLGVVFKKDKRVAELMKLAKDNDIKLLRQSLQAKIFLDSFDWQPIPLPEIIPFVPYPVQEGVLAEYMHGQSATGYTHNVSRKMRLIDADIDRRLATLKFPGLMDGGSIKHLIETEVRQCMNGHELRHFIRSLNAPSQAVSDAIASTYCRIKGVNRAIQAAHACMSSVEIQWRNVSLAPETLEQLRAEIEQAENFPELAPRV